MRKALIILTAALTALSLSACIPTSVNTHVQMDPDFNDPVVIEIDFVELNNAAIANFGTVADTPYTFIRTVDISGDNTSKTVTATVEAVDGADESDAEHFTAALLRHINDAAADQYTTFEVSDQDTFGNFYDSYSVTVNVTNESDGGEIYTLSVPAGEEIPLDPDIETYEDEWEEYVTIYLEGIKDEETMYDDEEEIEEDSDNEEADDTEETEAE